MILESVRVTNYKSIDDSGEVPVDPRVTVLVGINEAGKTAALEALHKCRPVEKDVKFNYIEDYPRKDLLDYERTHETNPATVCVLKYRLSDDEVTRINDDLGIKLLDGLEFTLNYRYDNDFTIGLSVPETPYIDQVLKSAPLGSELRAKVKDSTSLKELISELDGQDLNAEATEFTDNLKTKFSYDKSRWSNLLGEYIWKKHVRGRVPDFLYFDDYYLLNGKINLPELAQAVAARDNGEPIDDAYRTALSLLDMAGIDMDDLTRPSGYEAIKARLEGISNKITDTVFKYWTQNRELDVEFDIREDPNDRPPYNNGSNLYIRIKNRRHRVTVPFGQRSKGFIWFFSFVVWFGSVKDQIQADRDLILLLDEPGLSLHGLAQKDFLTYIGDLSDNHQIFYTTHSPFMVDSDRLHEVRTVEDDLEQGTKLSESLAGSDPKTLFPLQAALGYTIAQNLFIGARNLLVEGPADLVYLRYFSSMLEQAGRTALRDDVVIVPVGGLDKLATFVAILRGNELEMVVLHDYSGKPDQRLQSLARDRLIRERQVLNYAQFRTLGAPTGANLVDTDIEDLISTEIYLRLFNATYKKELGRKEVKEGTLPKGDRIVDRIERHLAAKSITLRPSGGFNHYLVANHLATYPLTPSDLDEDTLARFEALFKEVNKLFE
jgi:hypothetical protein